MTTDAPTCERCGGPQAPIDEDGGPRGRYDDHISDADCTRSSHPSNAPWRSGCGRSRNRSFA